jgi:hypothetical protein
VSDRFNRSLAFHLQILLCEARFLAGPLRLRFPIARPEERFHLGKTWRVTSILFSEGEVPSTTLASGPSIGSAGCTSSGARFEDDFLHGMDENRRADFERRFLLLHLNPHNSGRM